MQNAIPLNYWPIMEHSELRNRNELDRFPTKCKLQSLSASPIQIRVHNSSSGLGLWFYTGHRGTNIRYIHCLGQKISQKLDTLVCPTSSLPKVSCMSQNTLHFITYYMNRWQMKSQSYACYSRSKLFSFLQLGK